MMSHFLYDGMCIQFNEFVHDMKRDCQNIWKNQGSPDEDVLNGTVQGSGTDPELERFRSANEISFFVRNVARNEIVTLRFLAHFKLLKNFLSKILE